MEHYAGIFIERRRIRLAVVTANWLGSAGREPVMKPVALHDGARAFTWSLPVAERRDNAAVSVLADIARMLATKPLNVVGVGIGCYGPFVTLRRNEKREPLPGYGQLCDRSSDWPFRGLDLPAVVAKPFKERGHQQPSIVVQTDANVCALGEAYRRQIARDEVLVYLLLTDGIGGGFVTGRNLPSGPLHAEMGLIQVDLDDADPLKRIARHRRYGRSLGYLAAIPGMLERARKIHPKAETLSDIVAIKDDRLWPVAENYIAQLCLTCTAILAPSRIVLGGPMLSRRGLVKGVRTAFRQFLDGRDDGPQQAYAELQQDEYICEALPGKGLASELAGAAYLAIREPDLVRRLEGTVIPLPLGRRDNG